MSFPPQTLYLGSDIQVSRVTPFRSCIYGHMSSLQGDPTLKTLFVGSHIHSLQGDPTTQILHPGFHVHCLQGDTPPRL